MKKLNFLLIELFFEKFQIEYFEDKELEDIDKYELIDICKDKCVDIVWNRQQAIERIAGWVEFYAVIPINNHMLTIASNMLRKIEENQRWDTIIDAYHPMFDEVLLSEQDLK